ncbi:MAG: oligosaccharide flippase family protein [Solirubrobacteraceae bacterium]|nr:oligosaccharide flippase family protein [Solirubrobacteraceae bacterium]
MAGPLERIVRSGLAYQAAAFLSALLGIVTYKAYTTAVGPVGIANADLILSWLIFLSIFARLGFGEALLRHWYTAEATERPQLQRTIQGTVALVSAVLGVIVIALAPQIAGGLKHGHDAGLVRIAGAALFIYCNLDLAQALLRARDDRRAYLAASVSNVILTVALTMTLVVWNDGGARGYLVGNYAASAVILAALWSRELPVWLGRRASQPAHVGEGPAFVELGESRDAEPSPAAPHHHIASEPHGADETLDHTALAGPVDLGEIPESPEQTRAASRGERRALLRFGLPTVPSDAAIYGFNLLDRTILNAIGSAFAFGAFSAASKIAVGVILVARAFQLAFPPLAYSIRDPQQASRIYASAVRGYAVLLGGTVAGVALCAPWTVHVLVGVKAGEPDVRAGVTEVLPLLAAAWALWGIVPVMTTIAGRLGATKLTVPAAVVALAVNAAGLALLVPAYGAHGAAIALVVAYIVLLVVLDRLTRKWFPVSFDWPRIGIAIACSAAACLLAGPLADAPELGWGPAGIRLLIFTAMVVALWKFAVLPDERAEAIGLARRIARRTRPA